MNRRKARRYHVNQFVEVELTSTKAAAEGVAINLSRTGVGLCCLAPLEVGSPITVSFHFDDEQKKRVKEKVTGTIRWVHKLGHFYTAGVEFASEIDEDRHFLILSRIEQAREFDK